MILLIAGTAEGREIFSLLGKRGYPVVAAVATSYGVQALAGEGPPERAWVLNRALDEKEMVSLLKEKGIRVVVDASHPFAVRVSAHARQACALTGVKYIRYARPAAQVPEEPRIFPCRDFYQAARTAVSLGETIFLTTGSKTLPIFVEEARKHGKRIVARVLPAPEAVAGCLALGLAPADVIAMQGPFSYELNRAFFAACRAEVVVTKESGPAGGTEQKIKAALDLDIPVVLIERPAEEGPRPVSTYAELLRVLETLPKESG